MDLQHCICQRLILPWLLFAFQIIIESLSADLQSFAVKADFSGVFAVIGSACNIFQPLLFPDFRRHAAKKAAASSRNSFISLRRRFSFSNALIRFFSCWFSLAMLNASSGLRSPQPMSSSAVFTFCIQPYSVLTGICSSSAAAFADPRFWLTWPPALYIPRRILSSSTSSYPPFFLFSILFPGGLCVKFYYTGSKNT